MGVEEGVNHMWPISFLQLHPRAVIVCDDEAAVELNADTMRRFMDSEREKEDPRKSLVTGQ
jgi:glucosamine-6-phosphate deaminase